MSEKFNAIKYQNDFIRQKYDRFGVTFPKGKKDEYQNLAQADGMSLNALINKLLEEYQKQRK